MKRECWVIPRTPTSKSVDEQCSLKDKRRRLVRQHATEEEIDDPRKEKNVGRDYSVPYDLIRPKVRQEGKELVDNKNNHRDTKKDSRTHRSSEIHGRISNHISGAHQNTIIQIPAEYCAGGSISPSDSSRRTSNQSVGSASTSSESNKMHKNNVSRPMNGNSLDIADQNDIWEPRYARNSTQQRNQSIRLHPGLVTLDTFDKEQHCCILQWLWCDLYTEKYQENLKGTMQGRWQKMNMCTKAEWMTLFILFRLKIIVFLYVFPKCAQSP